MRRLEADQLCVECDPECFDFETTDELEPIEEIVGQERAVDAIRFGIGIEQEGFNLFAMGPSGIGKHHVISQFLDRRARTQPLPDSWCYVHNFDDPRSPRAIALRPGRANAARRAMERLVSELEIAIRSVFEGEDYRATARTIHHEFDSRHEDALQEVNESARDRGLVLTRTQEGFSIAPVVDGEVLGPDEIDLLDEAERERFDEGRERLGKELRIVLDEFPRWDRERRDAIRELRRETVSHAVAELFDEIRAEFEDSAEFSEHLDELERTVILDPSPFLTDDDVEESPPTPFARRGETDDVDRFSVNVLVDHEGEVGAPIVYEDDPTVENLLGRIDYGARFGALFTNFSLIRPGTLHRANGGYLVVDARKLLSNPESWEQFKRTLYAGEIRVQASTDHARAPTTLSLEPDPIPLEVKVVLVGERQTYYALRELDPDTDELFKVTADFDTEMERTDESVATYARLIATLAARDDLRAFDREAVARVVSHSSRIARDSAKLSAHMRTVADLLREADYWAKDEESSVVSRAHVQTAIERRIERGSRIRDLLAEQITTGLVVIETSGTKVGQVNGLSVIQFGQMTFGRPTRISAAVSVGRGEVLDIEREVDLGGPIHSKGMMILEGFLAARYAQKAPLSLTARIVFEQSYSGVDGDSASAAEACALLSALADTPIRQSVAITGSIDQYGNVQAVGGVNEKIEGFFELCEHRGLDGEHGVIIPAANLTGLMLRHDVVAAARDGKFSIWTVSTVDEAVELLTGEKASAIHEAATERTNAFADRMREFHEH